MTVLSAVLAFTLHVQQGVPQPPRTGLVVQVRDADRRAIGGASVIVVDAAGRTIAEAATTADGIARMGLDAGIVEVRITAAGFTAASERVAIDRASLASLDVTLTATPAAPPPPPRIEAPPEPPPESTMRSGIPPPRATPEPPPASTPPGHVFVPVPDRWNPMFPAWDRYGEREDYPNVNGHWWNPYGRNLLKGDYPAIGQRMFFVFTGVLDALIETRDVPTAAQPSSERPLSDPFFGHGDQYKAVGVARTSFDLFRGDTAFRPVDWRVRVQPAFGLTFISPEETGVVNRDVSPGRAGIDRFLGLQEAFVEKKLHDLSANYDFVSIRAGIQELSTDFRGFIAVVEQPGVRLFGTLRSSRIEYNVAVFDFLEKDTFTGLNTRQRRGQQMGVANVYVQDVLTPGYTTAFSVHYGRDAGGPHFDTSGFTVRPAPIGVVTNHEIQTWYLGWAGNGHVGRLNVNHAFYQALGRDDFNPIAARPVGINAQMAAAEASVDRDWLRLKGAVFWASGDGAIADGTARGFDSILDIPAFAGGPFSVWNRQDLSLSQTGTRLVSPFSLLPNLRTSKDEGQANFVNPGILILYAGSGAELTPKARLFMNASFLRFQHTESLEALLFQSPIRPNVGFDFGGGGEYRPLLSQNFVVTGGAAAMRLGAGLRDIYDRHYFISVFANLRFQF